jgi:hypothetical protein
MDTTSIRTTTPEVLLPECIHCCGSGWIYEATEDASYECWMCLGTGPKMDRGERERIKAERDLLEAQWSALERMGL